MRKNSKKVFTAVVTALFVLSISYFALLAPTTAWYYQDEKTEYDFAFGDFEVTQELVTEDIYTEFRAATRFADDGELLFDEVARVYEINISNNGNQKAFVHGKLEQTNDTPGLKWFLHNAEVTEAEPTYIAQKGPHKLALESMLSDADVELLTYQDETSYESANVTALEALDEYNKNGILLDSGESTTVYLVVWVEYGEVYSLLNSSSVVDLEYEFNLKCIAEPYAGEGKITFRSASTVNLVYTEEGALAKTLTVNANTDLELSTTVGSRFWVELPGGYTFDSAQTDATVSKLEPNKASGSINSVGNVITITANS